MNSHPKLEPAIEAMIEATNREDRDGLIAAFAPDASLVDFGRTFTGHDEIARWSDQENIGTHNRIEVTSVSRSGGTTTLGVIVSGDGYNGAGTLAFELAGERIARLVISA
jgi:ketosteroid isomerase-like protein